MTALPGVQAGELYACWPTSGACWNASTIPAVVQRLARLVDIRRRLALGEPLEPAALG